MQKDSSVFNIPSFAKPEIYDFSTTAETFKIYQELSQISEEIEQCRLKNS